MVRRTFRSSDRNLGTASRLFFPGRSNSIVLREKEERIADNLSLRLFPYCIFLHVAYIICLVIIIFLSFNAY